MAKDSGVSLQTGCRVTGVIEDERGHCCGVTYVDAGHGGSPQFKVKFGWTDRNNAQMTVHGDNLTIFQKLDRMAVIYDLMMNDVIEDSGQWLHGMGPLSREETYAALADRMQGLTIYEKPQIVDALEYAMEKGFLKNREYEGRRHLSSNSMATSSSISFFTVGVSTMPLLA